MLGRTSAAPEIYLSVDTDLHAWRLQRVAWIIVDEVRVSKYGIHLIFLLHSKIVTISRIVNLCGSVTDE